MPWTGQWSYRVDGVEVNDRVNQFCQVPELHNRPAKTIKWQEIDGDYPVVISQQPEAGRLTFLIAMRAISDPDFDNRIKALDRLFGDGSHQLIVQARGMPVERAVSFWVENTMVDYKQRLYAASASVPKGRWTGERLASLDTIAGWVAGPSTVAALTTGDKMVGTGSMTLTVTAAAAQTTSYIDHDTDLTPYLGRGRGLRVWVKASSLTNLTDLRLYLYAPSTGVFGYWTIKPTVAATWQEKEVLLASPTAITGTPDWLRLVRVGISVVPGAAYTGVISIDNIRIGSI